MNDNNLGPGATVIVVVIAIIIAFFMAESDGSSSSSKRECGYCGSSNVKAGTGLCYNCYNNMKGMESWLDDMN